MTKRIMVIDDDRGIRTFLQKSLYVKGYDVAVAERGAPGLQQLLSEDFDLVFLDLNMPEISGQTICAALRNHEKTKKLPVVIITAMFHTAQQMENVLQEYGANSFLLKPFTVTDLFNAVEELIGSETTSVPASTTDKGTEKKVVAAPAPDQKQDQHSVTEEKKAAPAKTEKPPLAGDLSKIVFPQLLHRLYQQKLTGLLHVQKSSAKKVIYIKNGYPVFARSNILGECLGRMLVKDDVITQVDCDQSIENSKTSGRLQGTVLIEMGLLTPQDLHDALKHQVAEKLLNVFAWEEGLFRFVEQDDFKKNVTNIELSPAALILEGIKKYWTKERVEAYLKPHMTDYLRQADNPAYLFQQMELSRRGEEVLAECLGDLTLEAILIRHPLSKNEVQQVLAALLIAGMIIPQNSASRLDEDARARRKADQPIDSELRKQILEDYKRIMSANFFNILAIDHNSDSSTVRRAYYKLAKQYHPDRYLGRGLSNDMESKVNEIFVHITQAYTILSDPTTRLSYRDELENGPKTKIDINQVIEAETAFQQGRALLKARQYRDAAKRLKVTIELSPEEPEYLTSYAWAVFKTAPDKLESQNQALEVLLASRELNPGLEETHLYLGYVYQSLNKERQAEKSFEMAVQANPSCTDALRELRLINLRRTQPEAAKGMFNKFRSKEK